MKVEVAVLGSKTLIVLMVSVDVKNQAQELFESGGVPPGVPPPALPVPNNPIVFVDVK